MALAGEGHTGENVTECTQLIMVVKNWGLLDSASRLISFERPDAELVALRVCTSYPASTTDFTYLCTAKGNNLPQGFFNVSNPKVKVAAVLGRFGLRDLLQHQPRCGREFTYCLPSAIASHGSRLFIKQSAPEGSFHLDVVYIKHDRTGLKYDSA